MVTTDKVTVTEFSPHIGKTTTDYTDDIWNYKENDMKMPWEQDVEWNNTVSTNATESGFNQTVRKDQATLIAELISRVTSLEEVMEYVLEHMPTTEQTEICDECVYVKGSSWCEKCDGKPKRVV